MIESRYWKEDLLKYAKSFQPVRWPSRWSEKLQVNFEKDVTVALFMIRKLKESVKLSSATNEYKAQVYRSPCVGKVTNSNFWDISELYDLDKEQQVSKGVQFICNQFIHGGAMFAYQGKDKNWEGIFTCSDFERDKYVYRIPTSEIIKILEIAGNDYPSEIHMKYDESKDDYVITTN